MKKILLCTAAIAMAAPSLQAQEEENVERYNLSEVIFESSTRDMEYSEQYPVAGVINHVSANGKYAVGYDDQIIVTNTGGSYLWSKDNPGTLTQLSRTYDRVSACDVSNDGVIVGGFEIRPNSDANGVQFPGWRTVDDPQWIPFPMPDQFSFRFAKSSDFAEEARAITPDGEFVAGTFHYRTGEKFMEMFNQYVDITCRPVIVWKRSGDGYALDKCYTELGKSGNNFFFDGEKFVDSGKDVSYQTFMVRDISNDGKVVAGMNVSSRGGFNPAFVRDGKLYQLFNCGEEGEPDELANFNGGTILTVDANGNMYGYYMLEDGITTKYFRFTADDKMEYFDQPVACADKDGNVFGVYDAGLNPVSDCSEDGTVVVGAGVGDLGFGAYNYPMAAIRTAGGTTAIKGIDSRRSNNATVNFDKNTLKIKGNWLCANILSADGKLLVTGNSKEGFDISRYPTGTYVVKVVTPTGIETFKISK